MTERRDTNVEWHLEPENRALVFSGRVNMHDIAQLRPVLDQLDRALLDAPITSAADLFQTLEMIFRRSAQMRPDGDTREL